jgi:hypothetical protein
MSFVITCRAWKDLFQEKEKKLPKLNRKKERETKTHVKKDTAGKSSMEKSMIKGECVLTAPNVSNLRHNVLNLQNIFQYEVCSISP